MAYEATGKIVHITPTETFGANGFRKRTFVLEVQDGQYTQTVPFELHKDRCDTIGNGLSMGQTAVVSFDLRGRQANNGNYYGSNVAFGVKVAAPPQQYNPNVEAVPAQAPPFPTQTQPDADLAF